MTTGRRGRRGCRGDTAQQALRADARSSPGSRGASDCHDGREASRRSGPRGLPGTPCKCRNVTSSWIRRSSASPCPTIRCGGGRRCPLPRRCHTQITSRRRGSARRLTDRSRGCPGRRRVLRPARRLAERDRELLAGRRCVNLLPGIHEENSGVLERRRRALCRSLGLRPPTRSFPRRSTKRKPIPARDTSRVVHSAPRRTAPRASRMHRGRRGCLTAPATGR